MTKEEKVVLKNLIDAIYGSHDQAIEIVKANSDNKNILLPALETSGSLLKYCSAKIKKDKDCVAVAISKDFSNIVFADESMQKVFPREFDMCQELMRVLNNQVLVKSVNKKYFGNFIFYKHLDRIVTAKILLKFVTAKGMQEQQNAILNMMGEYEKTMNVTSFNNLDIEKLGIITTAKERKDLEAELKKAEMIIYKKYLKQAKPSLKERIESVIENSI